MVWFAAILLATLFIAYANGANDNFKGVATLFGSGTTDYRKALWWATVTTFAGSLAAFFLAQKLVKTFSGEGLLPNAVIGNPSFMVSVVLGAGLTVYSAARMGLPISTTHSLIGALVGTGFVVAGSTIHVQVMWNRFFLPLLLSPVIAVVGTGLLYGLFHSTRRMFKINRSTCLCVGEKRVPVCSLTDTGGLAIPFSSASSVDVVVDDKKNCDTRILEIYEGNWFGVEVQQILDGLHFLSAGAVSFARGLNDTPKLVALGVAASVMGLEWNVALVALAMAFGGLVSARRVAETVSHKITKMNHGQGLTANLVTAGLVIFASRLGVPVSTTHVSCGALFGIGLANGKARWNVISSILGAWFLTLPIAAILSGITSWILTT